MSADLPWADAAWRYDLLEPAGRWRLLDQLTACVVGLDAPTQIWHGACPPQIAKTPRGGEAARLVRRLAETARTRHTALLATPQEAANAPAADGVDEPAHGPDRFVASMDMPVTSTEAAAQLLLSDGRLARVLALTTWPAALTPDWLTTVAELSAAVVLHLRPVPTQVAARILRRRLAALTSSAVVEQQAGRLGSPQVDIAVETARDLREAVARGTTRLLHTQVLLAVVADAPDALEERERQLHHALAGKMAAARLLRYQQRPAWAACQPGGTPLRWPWRLLDATSVAASIPHPVGPAAIADGVLAGVDPTCGAPLVVDRYAAHNPTRLVVGTSGAGKSYATKVELVRQLVAGTAVVVVDPEGEFGSLADALGGVCLAVGDEPAGLDPVGLACRPGLAASEGLSVLASWAAALLGGPLSAVDLALLDRALTVLRADRGGRPTPGDLLSVLSDLALHPPFTGSDLPARLAPASGGTLADLFSPNPDLVEPPALVVFDLRAVPDRARPAVMACVLTWAWSQTVGAAVAHRRLVVLDEAHLLLDDPPAAALLAQFARRARKYGVALEVVTQRLSDFLGHPAGEAVLANAAIKLVLGCEEHERAAITQGLRLTQPEAALLRPDRQGSGLLLTPDLRSPIQVVAGPAEHELASGGPARRVRP